MSEFSNYTEDNIIETTLRGVAFPVPASVYVALFTSDPGDNASGAEVDDDNWTTYARQDAADGGTISSGWSAASNGTSSNAKEITFPANNGSAVTITHMALFDAATGGNMLYHSALTASKTLQTSDVLSFAIGAISVTVD